MQAENNAARKPNPKGNANLLSKLFFFYMLPIFYRNCKKEFEEKDLFDTLEDHKAKFLGDKLEELWQEQNREHKKWALHIALFKLFGFELAFLGLLRLSYALLAVSLLPLSLSGLLLSFDDKSGKTETDTYIYAGLIIVAIVIDVFLSNHTTAAQMQLCVKMRVACSSLIYRKALKLSHGALGQTRTGQIVNLLSNDVNRFEQGFYLCNYIWIAPVQCIVGTYLIYRIIGVAALSGLGFLLLFLPLQFYFGKRSGVLTLRTAVRTDERIRLMNEFLSGIQVIKMYCWEKPFAKLISAARRHEMEAVRANLFLGANKFSLELILSRIAVFITIVVFISLGNNITADVIFPMMAVYDVFRTTITFLFSYSITSIFEVNVSVSRMQTFLNSEELSPLLNFENKNLDMKATVGTPKVSLSNVDASWDCTSSDKTLGNVSLQCEKGKLIAVIGKIGSGKSSLLNVILKELPILNGSMEIEGRISYASQEPWLFSASVKHNILFTDPYIGDRYQDVIKMCALDADIAMLPYGDQTIVGEKGKKLSGGQKARVNLARCVYKEADIYLLDDPLSAVDNNVGRQLYEDCITKFLSGKIRILVTHQLQYLRDADEIIILEEGKIVEHGTYDQLETSGLDFAKLIREFTGEMEQKSSNYEKIHSKNLKNVEQNREDDNVPEDTKEAIGTGNVSIGVYAAYFKAGGNYMLVISLVLATTALQGAGNMGDYYISQWVNMEQEIAKRVVTNTTSDEYVIDKNEITYWYSTITLAIFAFAVCQAILFFTVSTRASVNLHDCVVSRVTCATMRFFNDNPVGRILNRFSGDIAVIDEHLPYVMFDMLQTSLIFLGTVVLTSVITSWLLLPALGLCILFYLLRKVFIKTSRAIKRIEGITRSPILIHITTSLQGLSTIRASLAEQLLIKEFDNTLDVNSASRFLYIFSNKGFAFWLDFLAAFIVSIVTLNIIFSRQNYQSGEAGLILTQYIGLISILQMTVRGVCEMENSMVSVERLLEYTKIEDEPLRKKNSTIPRNWPELGKIVFEKVSMGYSPNEAPVLKGLNFTIYPLEKIGIVGRTGAGKSSIISALFQLYDIKGSILIDDVNTNSVPLEELRSKISIIPQDPVLFCATVRKNLDPFDEYDSDAIWNALEQVEMKQIIEEAPFALNSRITEGGSNFSTGQRQLLCLARAILRSNRILVMDEATANVDPFTDSLIQKTIRKNFRNCTVITVAHRLHTIIDSDRVLVVDAGEIVEFDQPYNLLQRKDGMFYNMVQTLGQSSIANFKTSAKKLN